MRDRDGAALTVPRVMRRTDFLPIPLSPMEDNTPEEAELIAVLPLWTVALIHGATCQQAVRLYRSYDNVCEHRSDRERCDESGFYYGSKRGNAARVIKLCPRHWYGIHFDPHPIYHLLDMTDEEHAEAIRAVTREKAAAMARIAEQLNALGDSLRANGFTEEAGRIYQTAGWVRASGRSL